MKRLEEINIDNQTVIMRCDFNVPFKDGKITDDNKIKNSVPTIKYLLERNCKIILLSHLGRVKAEEDKDKNSLKEVAISLANLLNHQVKFISHCYGEEVKRIVDAGTNQDIFLLENTRWMDYPEKLESKNNESLAKFWASLGDVYINDAFGSCHRAHASTAGIAKYIPHAIGFLVEKEIDNLKVLINNTPRPFTVFMGGAKVDDKLPIIKSLLPTCDYLLLGGGIANSFLKAQGTDVGASLATTDEEILNELRSILREYASKIILPTDFVKNENGEILDIGHESLANYQKYLEASETIFVNGTPGKYEEEAYSKGTKTLFNILANTKKCVIIGGGDTAAAVKKFGFDSAFTFISTGGGATLEYIANKKLEALEWME